MVLSGMFTQVFGFYQKGGPVKLGHVDLIGTRVEANASKHLLAHAEAHLLCRRCA